MLKEQLIYHYEQRGPIQNGQEKLLNGGKIQLCNIHQEWTWTMSEHIRSHGGSYTICTVILHTTSGGVRIDACASAFESWGFCQVWWCIHCHITFRTLIPCHVKTRILWLNHECRPYHCYIMLDASSDWLENYKYWTLCKATALALQWRNGVSGQKHHPYNTVVQMKCQQ